MDNATTVIKAWDGEVIRLISHRENAVYEVRLNDGTRAAMRLHRPGYQGLEGIEEELSWTEALAQRGFPCPRPLRTVGGDLTDISTGQLASVVSWVDAIPLAEQSLSPEDRRDSYFTLGKLLAQLHQMTDDMAYNCPSRLVWCRDGLTGKTPCWGRFWEVPENDADKSQLANARTVARDWLGGLKTPDEGLIHADALQENVLGQSDDMWLIDFDDSGSGYRLYDLGVALSQHWNKDDFQSLTQAISTGYAAVRGTSAGEIADLLPRFMTLRTLASAGWVETRLPPGDQRRKAYLDRALACSAKYFDVRQ